MPQAIRVIDAIQEISASPVLADKQLLRFNSSTGFFEGTNLNDVLIKGDILVDANGNIIVDENSEIIVR